MPACRRVGVGIALVALGATSAQAQARPREPRPRPVTPQSRIAFERQPDENEGGPPFPQIWIMNGDGSLARRLFAVTYAGHPALSPDGRRVAFFAERDLSYTEIYVMNADGTGVTRLTRDGHSNSGPAWSPDGSRLAFAIYRDAGPSVAGIQVMLPDGTAQTRLSVGDATDRTPAWSPDGARIAFVRDVGEVATIFVMNADGSGVTPLTDGRAQADAPAWSPDGRRIAFASDRDGNEEIYLMDPDGSNIVRLTTHPARDAHPAWSPDGARLAFSSMRDGNGEIYAMHADGTGLVRLTTHPGNDDWPSWAAVTPVALAAANPEPPLLRGTLVLPARRDSTRPLAVVVLLPYTTGTAAGLLEPYRTLLEGPDGFAAILVEGRGSADDYFTGDAWSRTIVRYERQVLADLAAFAAEHRLDTTRVVLAGYSMGGDLAWAIALRNPARIRGAVVMGSRASYRARAADHRALADGGVRFYFTLGAREEEVRLTGARAAARFLEQLGVAHRYREIPGGGHEWAPPPLFAEALRFVLGSP